MKRSWWRLVTGLALVGVVPAGCVHGGNAWPPARNADHPIRVTCLGDSLTSGFKLVKPTEDSYPAQLGRRLGTGWRVQAFAEPGRTLLKDTNLSVWKEKYLQDALASQPDAVVIMLGTNDTLPRYWDKGKAQFGADYSALIRSFQQLPMHPRVWVCLPPPMFLPPGHVQLPILAEQMLPLIAETARAEHAGLIDLFHAMQEKKALFPDTVHPNPEGAGLMAAEVAKALTEPVNRGK